MLRSLVGSEMCIRDSSPIATQELTRAMCFPSKSTDPSPPRSLSVPPRYVRKLPSIPRKKLPRHTKRPPKFTRPPCAYRPTKEFGLRHPRTQAPEDLCERIEFYQRATTPIDTRLAFFETHAALPTSHSFRLRNGELRHINSDKLRISDEPTDYIKHGHRAGEAGQLFLSYDDDMSKLMGVQEEMLVNKAEEQMRRRVAKNRRVPLIKATMQRWCYALELRAVASWSGQSRVAMRSRNAMMVLLATPEPSTLMRHVVAWFFLPESCRSVEVWARNARSFRLSGKLAEEARERERMVALEHAVNDFLCHCNQAGHYDFVTKETLKFVASSTPLLADVDTADSPQEAISFNFKCVEYHHFCIWMCTPVTGAMRMYGGGAKESRISREKLCHAWENFKRVEKSLEGSLW
eukprot:TRINITY_DN1159_c0_g1_i8.p1 TRINITY_DN1159_c0_g1~~TRINITY_DN1159_c0_g1_i8.p1  ORF type:complete len:406 (+),score=70.31 TRINITY_DN1159_c0_g1_i8:130-1347(+)